jgi:hypothetical protein
MTLDRNQLRAKWYHEGWYSDRTCLDALLPQPQSMPEFR